MEERADARYSRNIALFGREGQVRVANARVGVIGAGGLGCHVAQQLAYLGVLDFVLVDPDVITDSSLNRLVGAVAGDAVARAPKVAVVERLIRSIQRTAHVDARPTTVSDPDVQAALATCTAIFGCVDADGARLEMTEFCSRSRRVFFDLATDTGRAGSELWFGGRVLFSGAGQRCPSCMDLLDQDSLALYAMSAEQRAEQVAIYGVDRDDLTRSGPSVW